MQSTTAVDTNYLFDVFAEVAKFSIVQSAKRNFTLYQIDVKVNNRVFYLNKRYLDFETLNRKLKKKSLTVPDFPSKHLISRNTKYLEIRRQGLNAYLTKLLESLNGCLPVELVNFLELIEINDMNRYSDDREFDEDNQNDATELQINYPLISVPDADIKRASHYTVNDIIINGIISELYS